MNRIEINNMLKEVEKASGNKFEELFSDKQQEEILDLIDKLNIDLGSQKLKGE